MKIRNRITLWISFAGLTSSAVLSLVIFFWGLETPYEFLDQELEVRARSLATEIIREQGTGGLVEAELERFSQLYSVMSG